MLSAADYLQEAKSSEYMEIKLDAEKMGIDLPANETEDWKIQIVEISQGYYRITLKDREGRTVSRDGIDPDDLLKICKKDRLELQKIKS